MGATRRHLPRKPQRMYVSTIMRFSRPPHARVAKLADAKDLKSFFARAECGFKSRPGHHLADFSTKVLRKFRQFSKLVCVVKSLGVDSVDLCVPLFSAVAPSWPPKDLFLRKQLALFQEGNPSRMSGLCDPVR
jgi:hypothetical protein